MLAEVFSDIEFRRLPIGQGGVSFGAGTDAVTDAARDSYREMMWAEESIFMRIPAALRQKLVTDRVRASSGHWHQMFGQGIQIQSGLDGNADEVLLLQLGSDDMLSWMWYDVGLVHFWISPDDLAAGNWDAVKMTGEGH